MTGFIEFLNIPISRATLFAIIAGFLLDYILGDPQNPYHPVRFLGLMNTMGLKLYYRLRPNRPLTQFLYGVLMAVVLVSLTYLGVLTLLRLLHTLNFWLGFAAEVILSYFIIASKALYSESTPGGYLSVAKNNTGEESAVNIEALFNTVIKNKEEIRNIFNSNL